MALSSSIEAEVLVDEAQAVGTVWPRSNGVPSISATLPLSGVW